MEYTQLASIFITGLLAGGLTCMAVQGGLLAATIAQRHELAFAEDAKHGSALPIATFLIAKLIVYTALGFLLGSIGSAFQISLTTQILLQVAVAVFMLGTALHLLRVHPLFRYFIIQPPYFLTKFIRKQSKSNNVFAPALLGAFTVFIPCGTTQAMMALSVGSGDPLTGAIILFAFTLGTSPVFFLLGYFTSKITGTAKKAFTSIAAFILFMFALFNLNNAVALTGSQYTLETAARSVWCIFSYCNESSAPLIAQEAEITIDDTGYTPRNFSVKAGEEVTLRLTNNDSNNCAQSFTIPQLGVQSVVPMGTSKTVSFTAPDKPGTLSFMCSMGMYRGTISVI
jgi:uncharacterized protein